MTNVYKQLEDEIISIVEKKGFSSSLNVEKVTVEPPRDPAHGDMATNVAMVLTKQVGRPPRELAEALHSDFAELDFIESVEVAGPGFINFRLKENFWRQQLKLILEEGLHYGKSDLGHGQPVNIEYVSANPTGPLHAGHTRGAILGDVMANLMDFMGYRVSREYYVNDGGAQVDTLARSAYQRYLQALGEDIGEIPEGLYPGDYLVPVGAALAKEHGDTFKGKDESEWLAPIRAFTIEKMMDRIKQDLSGLGIVFDTFSSEREMMESGKVEEAIAFLDTKGLIYEGVLAPPKGKTPDDWEARPQTLFKATEFGDDTDRPLKKSDGSNTYFANDIAYHLDKVQRTGPHLIDVLGADHAGYVKRIQAAVKAITGGEGQCDVLINNLINLVKDGAPVKMSKRSGQFETAKDVVDAVGKDVLRFMLLTRKHDQIMDFDLDKVKEQSRDNPVFYVQYAHARCGSVLRHAAEMFAPEELAADALAKIDLSALKDPAELHLIKLLATYPRQLEQAVSAREPHRLAFFAQEVAGAFHALWHRGSDNASLRFLLEDDKDLTKARLALVKGVKILVASCLTIFGVEPVEQMN